MTPSLIDVLSASLGNAALTHCRKNTDRQNLTSDGRILSLRPRQVGEVLPSACLSVCPLAKPQNPHVQISPNLRRPPCVTSNPGQLSLLPSVGREVSIGQSTMMRPQARASRAVQGGQKSDIYRTLHYIVRQVSLFWPTMYIYASGGELRRDIRS